MTRVGVLGLQGGVREHLQMLRGLGAEAIPVRTQEDLTGPDGVRVDAMVLPGGESSVIDRLLHLTGLFAPLQKALLAGLPALGTCAGLIELSKEVRNPAPGQQSLGVLGVEVDRNAFGPQIASRVATIDTEWGPVRGALIRAPQIMRVYPGSETVARDAGALLGARTGRVIGISFHPELTGDDTVHRAFLSSID